MVLRLNPRVPVLWRDPHCMQLGVDVPVCTLPGASSATQRMLAALAVGVPRSGLSVIGRRAGATEDEVVALLNAVRPALLGEPAAQQWHTPQAQLRIALDGSGTSAEIIRTLLEHEQITVLSVNCENRCDEAELQADAAVIIGRFAIAPTRHGAWLRRDIPHLPVIFGDRLVRIGPFVTPGLGPCLRCVELERVDADAAWPAMASQLEGKTAAAETMLAATDAAARVAHLIIARFDCPAVSGASANTSALIDARTGEITTRTHLPHERCGCRVLPENVTPLEFPRGKPQISPSSAAIGDAHA